MSLLEIGSEISINRRRAPSAGRVAPELPAHLFGYDIIRRLGEGAGSIVYEVQDPSTRRHLALKHVVVREPRHLRFVEQLEGEHEVGQAVRHEGLRQPLAIKYRRTLLRRVTEAALVMELVEGWPISAPSRPMPQCVDYLVQVSRTLEALHRAGFVHCDLKPQNLLVDANLRVKLIDLGQACRAGTVKERVQGTPDFISPEQVRCRQVTSRTDVYNFGATAYCILTGKKIPTLFTLKKGNNSFLLDDRLSPPHELCPDVPLMLSELVMQCIALKPEQRPDMSAVTRRLDAIQYTQRAQPVSRPMKRRS